MSDVIKTDYQLNQWAESIAQDIFDEFKGEKGGKAFDAESFGDEMRDRIWEDCDNSQHVIYTHRAIAIATNCNTDDGGDRLCDWSSVSGKPFADCDSFGDVCTKLAFAEMLCRAESALQALIDDWEPDDTDDTDDKGGN